jgi:hypothetical protein
MALPTFGNLGIGVPIGLGTLSSFILHRVKCLCVKSAHHFGRRPRSGPSGSQGPYRAPAQFGISGRVRTAAEAVAKCLAFKPDVAVMDIRRTGSSGIDACREITTSLPEAKVIILTRYAEDEMLFAAVRTGAAGYVFQQADG